MTTEMTLFDFSTIPANLKITEMNENTLSLAGSPPQGKRISIEGGVFRMFADGKEVAKTKDRDMNIVPVKIAKANNRIYYDPSVTYVKGQAVAPLCSSEDGVHSDAKAIAPQSVLCASCPQNIAGSGQGEARACRFQRRIAVVLESDIAGSVYQIVLPAKSLFGKGQGTNNLPLEAYARMLAMNNVNVDRMVAKMEFDTDASTPKLTFSPARHLSASEITIVEAQGSSDEAAAAVVGYRALVPRTPVARVVETLLAAPEEDEAPAPVVKKAAVKPAAKAKPVVADDEPEDVVVVEPAPEATRKEKLSAALSAWGD